MRAEQVTHSGGFTLPDCRDRMICDTTSTVSTELFLGKTKRSKPLLVSLTSERTWPFSTIASVLAEETPASFESSPTCTRHKSAVSKKM